MTSEAPRPRFPLGLTLAALVAFAILCSLGAWQVRRLAWKTDMIARVEAARTAPAAPLADVLARASSGADVEYTRVEAVCTGLATAPFIEIYALDEGKAGARLVSACRIEAGGWRTILVDRGFVDETVSMRPPVDAGATTPMTVRGILRGPGPTSGFAVSGGAGGQFHSREIAPIAAALKAEAPAPLYLMAETSTTPGASAVRPISLPVGLTNRHLEYAVTWFGLAAALVGVYAAMLWKRLRRR